MIRTWKQTVLASALAAVVGVGLALSLAAAPAAKKDIVDTAVAAGSFKTLTTAIQAAGLTDTLKGQGPFTVFAPTDDAFAPTWTLAIPGAAAVVRLAGAGGQALEAHCEAVEVMLLDAESVMGSLDTAVPAQVAALVRSALEMADLFARLRASARA